MGSRSGADESMMILDPRATTFANVKPRTTNTIMFVLLACGHFAAAASQPVSEAKRASKFQHLQQGTRHTKNHTEHKLKISQNTNYDTD